MWRGWGVKLTTFLLLVPRLRMHGARLHSPVHLHGMVHGKLSTSTVLSDSASLVSGFESLGYMRSSSSSNVRLSPCFNWAPRRPSRILDFGIVWRWAVSFTPQPLYPQGKSPWYPLDRKLGGAPVPGWTRWWREKFPAPAGARTPRLSSP
jgi:hypothetical protein